MHPPPPPPPPPLGYTHVSPGMPGTAAPHAPFVSAPPLPLALQSSLIPFSETMDLEEFCHQFALSDRVLPLLRALQFVPGDDLSDLTPTEWTDASFVRLSQNRIMAANKRYRTEERDRLRRAGQGDDAA
jgi:hypothetical protein